MKMTSGGFQFLYLRAFITDDEGEDNMKSKDYWRRNDSRDEDAREAYGSLLIVSSNYVNLGCFGVRQRKH